MADRKTKIVFEQVTGVTGLTKIVYRVVSLTNRTQPKIGSDLKEDEVQSLISDENLTVEIKPGKNSR